MDVTGEPLSRVPFSDPRSSTVTAPDALRVIFAWRRDRLGSVRSNGVQPSDLPITVSPMGRSMVAPAWGRRYRQACLHGIVVKGGVVRGCGHENVSLEADRLGILTPGD